MELFNFLRKTEPVEAEVQQPMPDFGKNYKHTPDIMYLERFEFVPLFVCDEMMRDFAGYGLFKDHSFYNCSAYTQDRFLVLRKNLGKASSFIPLDPAEASIHVQRAEVLPIRGEVHFIRPYQVARLDTGKLNGVEFNRIRVKLQVPYQKKLVTPEGGIFNSPTFYDTDNEAYMYVGKYDRWQWAVGEKQFSWSQPIAAKVPYHFHHV